MAVACPGKWRVPRERRSSMVALPMADNLTWEIEMTSPMPMTLEVSAAVDGDTIGGNVKLGAFGDATFTGTRV